METLRKSFLLSVLIGLVCFVRIEFGSADASIIQLKVDAREAPRRIFHARLIIPAVPGPITLLYPKWIPGEHGPTGPIRDLAGLHIFAKGKDIAWQRDPVDLYAFHCEVPPETSTIEVRLDYLSPANVPGFTAGASTTAQLAAISWQQLLLYPKGKTSDELQYAASLELPADWKFGTALPLAKQTSSLLEFKPVSLTTLVDSPLIAGKNFRTIPLDSTSDAPVFLHLVADSEEALRIPEKRLQGYKSLVRETLAFFGARHFEEYHFLLTLTDNAVHFGLEHHQSSDNRAAEKMLIDDAVHRVQADLLPHEFVHSWNAKYRRPEGLVTSDYQQPMKGNLLWVYEGLTTYLGNLLAARSGLWSAQDYHEHLALTAADMQQRGRSWRPLEDTAVAAQILYEAPAAWSMWRRGVDFYPEGDLIWLEADVLIRKLSDGKKSLTDFCRMFYGGKNTPPMVKPYTYDELIQALNQVQPYDWNDFFDQRVKKISVQAPLGGIVDGGWNLVFTEIRPQFLKDMEEGQKEEGMFLNYSIGLYLDKEGNVKDIVPDSAAAKAGIGPGMKIIAVNQRRFSRDVIRAAVKSTKGSKKPLELLVENAEYFKTYELQYHEGERYPQLQRDESKRDVIGEILTPLAGSQ